jgi:hypothetical protein
MKLRTFALSSSLASLLAIGLAACSQGADGGDASVAASPLVQAAGVQRIKFLAASNVTHVDLLDEAGQEIGTLVLETTGEQEVRARQTLHGHTLDATWNAQELSFTRNAEAPVSVRAGEQHSDALDDTLERASEALTVATFVAAQVGVYSPVDPEGAFSQPQDFGDWGTGCNGHWNYSGSSSTWSNGQQAALACQQAAAQAAYSTCVQINGSMCNTSSTTTTTTTVTPGYFTGYTCTTTISVGYNCNH